MKYIIVHMHFINDEFRKIKTIRMKLMLNYIINLENMFH